MKYYAYLVLTAFIWGTTFVFQRVATDTMGPFAFGAVRFALGALAITPLVYREWRRQQSFRTTVKAANAKPKGISLILACCILGSCLFAGSTLQQVGLVYTTAGKSGFITALYIVLVPLIGLILYQPLRISHVVGTILSVVGLYYLAFPSDSAALNLGDLLTLIGVVFWSLQILFVDQFVRYHSGIYLACGQFIVCAIWSFIAAFIVGDQITGHIIALTIVPILYAGILSCGVAFTLQIIAQKHVPPTEGSMIMSLEMIFGALLGFLALNEIMSLREFIGAVLMTIGICLAQLKGHILWVRSQE